MDSQTFKKNQLIAYQTIINSIKNNRLSHAYLFHGPNGLALETYVEYFAKCLLCENKEDGLACGVCSNCQRVDNGLYADIITMSKGDKSIGKADIIEMISRFNKTALEKTGLKFYFIYQIEHATVEALNSLLKFLEEPGNDNTYAILTTNQIDKVLPTIVSRCLAVPFRNHSLSEINELLADKMYDKVKLHLLSGCYKDPIYISELIDDSIFERAYSLFKQGLRNIRLDYQLAYLEIFSQGLIDKKEDKQFLTIWLDLNIQFLKDLEGSKNNDLDWYFEEVNNYQGFYKNNYQALQILLAIKDRIISSANIPMVVDSLFYQLKGAIK